MEIKWAIPKSSSTIRTDFAKYECDKTDPKIFLKQENNAYSSAGESS